MNDFKVSAVLQCDSRRFNEAEQFAHKEAEIDQLPWRLEVLEAVRSKAPGIPIQCAVSCCDVRSAVRD